LSLASNGPYTTGVFVGFGVVVCELAQCFGGGNADADGDAGVLQNERPEFCAPRRVVGDIQLSQVKKSLVYTVEFDVRCDAGDVVVAMRSLMSPYSSKLALKGDATVALSRAMMS
jgi:hypothetical protein